jgi:hypothetical protein
MVAWREEERDRNTLLLRKHAQPTIFDPIISFGFDPQAVTLLMLVEGIAPEPGTE